MCFTPLSAQPGCTDPQALNFDPFASENNGSCIYPETYYDLIQISELPEILKECSGTEYIESGLWALNDSGNENNIYLIDSLNGALIQSLSIFNAENIDWEDIAESENYLYIGDFGNNPGNRTDLKIYRLHKSELINDTIIAEVIQFEYSDQVDFTENLNNHNFDCEAFVFYNDQLHLFSKNWMDHQTKHYILSAEPGTHIAQLKEIFDVEGLITGADISDENELVLIGYTELGFNFLWLLFDFNGDDFFSGNKRKISLGTALTNSQTESITFRENGYGYIGSEEFKVTDQITLPQKLLGFSIKQWTSIITPTMDISSLNPIKVYPNPSQSFIEIENANQLQLPWRLYDKNGLLVKNGKTTGVKASIDISNLPPGVYYLSLIVGSYRKNITLIKQ